MKKINELRAEIKKAEQELEGKKKELELIEKAVCFKVGDYVEYQVFGRRFVGIIRSVLSEHGGDFAIEVRNGVTKPTAIPPDTLIMKWKPKRGDLCIFWDIDKKYTHIGIFDNYAGTVPFPFESHYSCFRNCIPFISEKQFKEHIGYEN